MAQISDASVQEMLAGRYVATLATENDDGTIHMVAVWYFYEGEKIYVATSSRTRKAQNLRERSKVSLMIDSRDTAAQRGICVAGTAQLLSGAASREWTAKVHHKYLSADALADAKVGPVFAQWDDVTIQIAPNSVIAWDMRDADKQAFGGSFEKNPGYLLPVER